MEQTYTKNIQDLIYSSTEIMKEYTYLLSNELVVEDALDLISTNMGILDGLVKAGFLLDLEDLSPQKEEFITLFSDVVEENQLLLDNLHEQNEEDDDDK